MRAVIWLFGIIIWPAKIILRLVGRLILHRLRAWWLFNRMTKRRTLRAAWAKVYANMSKEDRQRPAVVAFERNAGNAIRRLSRSLRDGTYRPGRVRHFKLRKRDGTTRRLSVPPIPDRIAQTAAAMALGGVLDPSFSTTSFAYRPGRSVRMAVGRVRQHARNGHTWLVDGDIRAFFDSVPHSLLLRRLEARIGEPRVLRLMSLWLASFSARGQGLAQGSPLSPLLTNVFLDPLDRRIQAWPGTRWVRYSDDFVLMCRDRHNAVRARRKLARELQSHGLELHYFKTRITSFSDGFFFLGTAFRGESLAAMPRRRYGRRQKQEGRAA